MVSPGTWALGFWPQQPHSHPLPLHVSVLRRASKHKQGDIPWYEMVGSSFSSPTSSGTVFVIYRKTTLPNLGSDTRSSYLMCYHHRWSLSISLPRDPFYASGAS